MHIFINPLQPLSEGWPIEMMSWLREFRRKMVLWGLTFWRWLGRARLLWLAIGIIVLGLTIIANRPSKFSLKLIGMLFQLSITVAGPFLTKKASLILYVLRTCPVQIRPGKRHEAAI